MTESLTFEVLNRNDVYEVVELNASVGIEVTERYLKWLYRDTPEDLVWVARDEKNDRMVGHYAVVRCPIRMDNEVILGVQGVGALVHPSYRARGIFTSLARLCYEHATSHGIKIVVGVTDSSGPAYRVFVRRLHRKHLGHMPVYVFPVKPLLALRAAKMKPFAEIFAAAYLWLTTKIRKPHRPDDPRLLLSLGKWSPSEMANLVSKTNIPQTLVIHKDRKFYTERFRIGRAGWSDFMPICVEESRELVAFAICSIHQSPIGKEGVIADLHSVKDESVLNALIYACVDYVKKQGAIYVRLWAKKPAWIVKYLKQNGFVDRHSAMSFQVRMLTEDSVLESKVFDFDRWQIDLCDTDQV